MLVLVQGGCSGYRQPSLAEPNAAPPAAAQQPSPNPASMLDSPPNSVLGVRPAPAYTGHRGVQGTMQLVSVPTFAGDRCNSRSASTRRRTHRPRSAGPTSTLDSGYPITTTCTSSPRAAVRYTGTRSQCGAVLCPLPGVRGAHSAALRPVGDYAPHGVVWPARLFASFLRRQRAVAAGEGSASRASFAWPTEPALLDRNMHIL